ncbi:TPA: SGNH/GDSL hydrolase family protein [Clostridium perfringens]
MKEIIVNVDNYNENSIKTIEGDNLSEVYKIYICKNKRRIDLTNKIAIMAYVNEYGNKKSNILALNITNAAEGEIELPITNVISNENGVYACQIAIYGENNSLEQTAPFSLIVENNIFSKISNSAINSSDFHILSEAIKTTNAYGEKLKEGTENIELQYADKLNKINLNKMDRDTRDIAIHQINKNKGKIDQTYLSDELLKQMAGDTPVNAVPADLSITTIKLANNSVDYEKAAFFDVEESYNKFNKDSITHIGYVLNGSGGYTEHPQGCVSDFIPVKKDDIIRANLNWNGEFYNENKEFLSSKEFGTEEFKAPKGAYYYRQSILMDRLANIMITINSPIGEYIPFKRATSLTKELAKIIENGITINPDNTSFFIKDKVNLYDSSKSTIGFVVGGDGALVEHSDGCVSDFIEVEPSTMYYYSDKWNAGYYTKNKVFISQKQFGITNEITPDNAYYVRISIPIAKKDTYMFVKDYMPSEYIPYSGFLKFDEKENIEKLVDQIKETGKFDSLYENRKWAALGDSLTEKNITAKENYTDFVSKDLGITCINYGIGGTGYRRRYDINKAFYQRVSEIQQDVDVITVFGSGNDMALIATLGDVTDNTTDTICGCINKTIDNLIEKFPTTPIGIIAPTPWRGNTPENQSCSMARYVDKLEEICKLRGIPYLDLYHHSNLHPNNDKCMELTYYNDGVLDGNGDGVHPNDLGHKIISSKIREFIKTLIK